MQVVRSACWTFLIGLTFVGQRAIAGPAPKCERCHENPKASGAPQIHPSELAAGVHANVPCVGCHPEAGKAPHPETPPPVGPRRCGACHQTQHAEYAKGAHGKAYAKGDHEHAPGCTDCHGRHRILSSAADNSPVSPKRVVGTCAKCHDDPVVLGKAELSDSVVETYFNSYHGLVVQNGMTEAANCASCHGHHAVLPSSDPGSPIHPRNLSRTCGKCHFDADRFVGSQVHVGRKKTPERWWKRLRLFFPIANRAVNPLFIVGLGALVGTISAIFGVGGGFLLTPMLIFIGIPPAVAAATDSATIVAHGSSGTLGHYRNGNVDLKMGILTLSGGLVGGTSGVFVVRFLRQLGNFNVAIRLVYIVVLTAIGLSMVMEGIASMRQGKETVETETEPQSTKFLDRLCHLPMQTFFPRSGVRCSAVLPFGAGCIVGLLAAFLGSGGGFIMLPVMIYLLGMPTRVAVGTNLFQVTLTCVNVALQQVLINHTVDLLLAIALFVGSVLGAQVGVQVSRVLRGEQTRALLGLLVLGVMIALFYGMLVPPHNLIALAKSGGH